MEQVRINTSEIPDCVFDSASRIIDSAVRRFFSTPEVKSDFERWCQTEEGQRAAKTAYRKEK